MTIPRCQSGLALTRPQVVALTSLPNGAHTVPDAVVCELQQHHRGRQAALGQTDGWPQDWWIRWGTEIVRLTGAPPPSTTTAHAHLPMDTKAATDSTRCPTEPDRPEPPGHSRSGAAVSSARTSPPPGRTEPGHGATVDSCRSVAEPFRSRRRCPPGWWTPARGTLVGW